MNPIAQERPNIDEVLEKLIKIDFTNNFIDDFFVKISENFKNLKIENIENLELEISKLKELIG